MAYETALGKSIVPVADIADIAADVNVSYPNGIGKKKGMLVYVDMGATLEIYMAQGEAPADLWSPITTGTDVTPA